jgi:hypothetical protein
MKHPTNLKCPESSFSTDFSTQNINERWEISSSKNIAMEGILTVNGWASNDEKSVLT